MKTLTVALVCTAPVLAVALLWQRTFQANDSGLKAELSELRSEITKLRSDTVKRQNLSVLDSEVRALKTEQRYLSTQAVAQATASPQSKSTEAEVNEHGPRLDQKTRIEEEKFRNVQVANRLGDQLDARLAAEAPDPRWAAATASAIRSTVAAISGDKLLSSDCKASLCRVEIEHDSPAEQHRLAKSVLGSGPFEQDVMFRYDFDSSPPRTTMYVAREGIAIRSLVDLAPLTTATR